MTTCIFAILVLCLIGFPIIRKRQLRKHRETKIIQVDNNNCRLCRQCIARCRHDVLGMITDGKITQVTVIHPDRCSACGHCTEVCRFNAIKLIKKTE